MFAERCDTNRSETLHGPNSTLFRFATDGSEEKKETVEPVEPDDGKQQNMMKSPFTFPDHTFFSKPEPEPSDSRLALVPSANETELEPRFSFDPPSTTFSGVQLQLEVDKTNQPQPENGNPESKRLREAMISLIKTLPRTRGFTPTVSCTHTGANRVYVCVPIVPVVPVGLPTMVSVPPVSQSFGSGGWPDLTKNSTSSLRPEAQDDMYDEDDDQAQFAMHQAHLRLLDNHLEENELDDIKGAPFSRNPSEKYARTLAKKGVKLRASDAPFNPDTDPHVFWNIGAPSSFFICGSQGSGKSRHLSCLLENALVQCEANILPRPLTGIVFHYDSFVSDTGGSPCKAAWLASNPKIKVRVLCPQTNIYLMRKLYAKFPNIQVEELRLQESDFNTTRMMDLMAISPGAGMPLYMSVVNRLLREQRIQQKGDPKLDYLDFKMKLSQENMTDMQIQPLKQHLDTLESFMVDCPAKTFDIAPVRSRGYGGKRRRPAYVNPSVASGSPIDWAPRNGTLTIVDLSCPCVTSEMACSLFNICLSLFLEQNPQSVGRVIALDETHKYMNGSPDSQTLTNSLLSVIRLQRHVGARILIATQELTISPKLMDLCSVTVCHRFTSPEWFDVLKDHIAAPSRGAELVEKMKQAEQEQDNESVMEDSGDYDGAGTLVLGKGSADIFSKIVSLKVGEALVFAPSAIIGVEKPKEETSGETVALGTVRRLADGVMKIRVRNRVTDDGGRSVMA